MNNFQFFEKYDQAVDDLNHAGKHEEALALLQQALAELSNERYLITQQLLYAQRTLKQYDKCLQLLDECVQAGFFFSLGWDSWQPVKALAGAERVWAENERLFASAKAAARMRYQVHLPDDYDSDRAYPLFMTMHGNGVFGSIDYHSYLWKPDIMLKQGYIAVYVQSSNVSCTGGHSWIEDLARDRDDLLTCYDAVVADYTIDTSQIIVSGFSGGGEAALNLALTSRIPVTGFIALCPDKPADFTPENAQKMSERSVRGVIIEGKLTGEVPDQQVMLKLCKDADVPCEYIIAEGVGHWYPLDMPTTITKAIQFIRQS